MSADGTGARRSLRRPEVARLVVVAAVAVGAVLLGQALFGSAHHRARNGSSHDAPGAGSGSGSAAGARAGGKQDGGSSLGASWPVAVADGPAVMRSLQHGEMIVAVDQPSSSLFAEQNRSISNGATVGADELNAGGGLGGHIRVKLVPQSLDGLSASALRSRLTSEGAAALILPCDTDSELSLTSEAAKWGMLMIAPCNPDPTAGQHYPTFWPVGTGASDEVAGLTNYMRLFGYPSTFLVNVTGDRYSELLTGYFQGAAKAAGIRIAGSSAVPVTAADLSSVAAAVKSSGHLAGVFAAAPPPFVDRLGAALRASGVDRPVIGTAAMDTPLSLSAGGSKALENAVFTSYGFPREDAAARRFARDYESRFHRPPAGGFPGLGLEAMRLLAAAARKAGSGQPPAIQRALAGGVTLSGEGLAARTYQRGGDHNPVGELGISKIGEGALLAVAARTP